MQHSVRLALRGVNTWKWLPAPRSIIHQTASCLHFSVFLSHPPTATTVCVCVLIRQVGFEDVIAEPISTHSFDRVWIGSHAAFELVKFILYRLLSTLLAVPLAFVLGLLFGVLSCIHIW